MLTYAEVRDIVARFTYRAGRRLETYEDPHEGLAIAITTEVEDAYHPGHTIVLTSTPTCPRCATARPSSTGCCGAWSVSPATR